MDGDMHACFDYESTDKIMFVGMRWLIDQNKT